jgi:hypothetical protein
MLIIFLEIKEIVHKEFILAGKTFNSTQNCEVLRRLCENVRRLRPELWQWTYWLLHHYNFLIKNNTTVVPGPCHSPLFPQLEMRLKDRQFNTIEVTDAESQAVLNTLTEHDFHDELKK